MKLPTVSLSGSYSNHGRVGADRIHIELEFIAQAIDVVRQEHVVVVEEDQQLAARGVKPGVTGSGALEWFAGLDYAQRKLATPRLERTVLRSFGIDQHDFDIRVSL
jgi:hypothetical protein